MSRRRCFVHCQNSAKEGPDKITVTSMHGSPIEEGEQLYLEILNSISRSFNIESSVSIDVQLELPVSQGFGMQQWIATTSLALGEVFDCGDEGQLARLAHMELKGNFQEALEAPGPWAGVVNYE